MLQRGEDGGGDFFAFEFVEEVVVGLGGLGDEFE